MNRSFALLLEPVTRRGCGQFFAAARASQPWLVGTLLLLVATAGASPPATVRRPVTETYHGVTVSDDYRWLEAGDNPAVHRWSDAQNASARTFLARLPEVAALRARITAIMTAKTVSYGRLTYRPGQLFAMRWQPPQQQPQLVVMPSAAEPGAARVLVDPNTLDSSGTTAIDWYVVSADGKHVAVSLSQGGSESGDVTIYATATGQPVDVVLSRVNGGTAGGDVAWAADGSGLFYTRYPRQGERPAEDMDFYQQVYFHRLGTPVTADRYEIGKEFPRIAEVQLAIDPVTGCLLATVQKGDGGEFALYLRSPAGSWRQFSRFGDGVVQATFGAHGGLYLVSRDAAPRGQILRIDTNSLDLRRATTIVPQGRNAIVTDFMGPASVVATADRIYVTYQLGGPTEIRVFDLHGTPLALPRQLPVSSVSQITPVGGNDILFRNESFLDPPAFYRYTAATEQTRKTALATQSPVAFDDAEVVREFAVSNDGTRVPLSVIMPKGTVRDGTHACLATGYGGYGVNIVPRFSGLRRVLLDAGAISVVANLRGGGEYGQPWHRQGCLTHKQNVFDDFAAVLRHLIQRRYTEPSRLAIIGGSNGGLLMGATMTQHPNLVKAVVSYVGIYDMLRVERSPNGAFNVTEFGSVKDPAQFHALYAYSPYHHVHDGIRYPATLLLTGANDPRVDPMQSRKMAARLQAASAGDAPILLRTSGATGHGLDAPLSERIDQAVDVDAFLFDQLGLNLGRGSDG